MKPTKPAATTPDVGRLWLAVDVNNLCHRAFHTTGQLSLDGEPTGVTFGVLREINSLRTRFGTNRIAFCFDHGKGLREKKFSWYKESRRTRKYTDEEAKAREGLQTQIKKLKFEYLTDMGYRNVIYQDGYEADDHIAAVVAGVSERDRVVIVSGDQDLYQLLCHRVSIYKPQSKTLYTEESFKDEFGVESTQWPYVKAISGCSTDDIPGIEGVAEKTACKYLQGYLGKETKKYKSIKAWESIYERNLELVTLPYPGCNQFKPKKDEYDPTAYAKLIEDLGFASFDTGSVLSRSIQSRKRRA